MADPVWTLSIVLTVVLGGFLLLWGLHCSSGWRVRPSKSGARLPKGSFGWPVIGETLAFALNPATYASSHVKRYGRIFKTSLFGQPVIMGLSPEFSNFVIGDKSGAIVEGFPAILTDLVGPNALLFLTGPRHTSMKKILQRHILPDALRLKVNTLETIVLEHMASWEQKGTVIGKQASENLTMYTGIWLILGFRDIGSVAETKELIQMLELLNKALFSTPVNLPLTPLNRGLKAKRALSKYFRNLVEKRKGQENSQTDMLGSLLAAQEDPQAREEVKDFTVDMIVDNLLFFFLAAHATSANTLLWVLKLLLQNPEVFRRIQVEQQEILKGKDLSVKGPRLSWEDTRKMVYTQKFFQEVQRIASSGFISFRKVTQDVEYEGLLLPKGWNLCLMQSFIHSDPEIFPEPEKVNPDRFDVTPKPCTYMPFSMGTHMCPGIETAKLISLIFVHHLTTSYIYESAGEDKGVVYSPLKTPKGGYPINIRRRN